MFPIVLERAYRDRAIEFSQWSSLYPGFKSLESEPRFRALMKEIAPLL